MGQKLFVSIVILVQWSDKKNKISYNKLENNIIVSGLEARTSNTVKFWQRQIRPCSVQSLQRSPDPP